MCVRRRGRECEQVEEARGRASRVESCDRDGNSRREAGCGRTLTDEGDYDSRKGGRDIIRSYGQGDSGRSPLVSGGYDSKDDGVWRRRREAVEDRSRVRTLDGAVTGVPRPRK